MFFLTQHFRLGLEPVVPFAPGLAAPSEEEGVGAGSDFLLDRCASVSPAATRSLGCTEVGKYKNPSAAGSAAKGLDPGTRSPLRGWASARRPDDLIRLAE